MDTPISNRKRARKAYRLANKLVFSYLSLWLAKKIFGKRYYERRITAVHTKNAGRVKKTIDELRGLFIKVGQLISSMSHILPEPYMVALESMQDKAPVTPLPETLALIETELSSSISSLFSEFDDTPIASASIGQVYKATLLNGDRVAVKVQHVGIEALAEADLKIVQTLVNRISWFFKIKGIEHVYGQISLMIREELDYSQEASSMQRIRENLSSTEKIIIPEVIATHSSKRILTTRFQEGTKINNIQQLDKWNIDRNELAERLILTYCKMILEHGFYHADPHPGNLLVTQSGDIVLLDFGAVAVMNETMRKEIPILIQAVLRKDTSKILVSLRKIGFVGNDESSTQVAEKLINALNSFIQDEIKIDNMNFKEMNMDDLKGSSIDNLRKEIGIRELTKIVQVPKDWILLDRTLQLLTGTSFTLSPEVNPVKIIKPYMKRLLIKDGGLKSIIVDAIKQQITSLLTLPNELSRFLKKANNGEIVLDGFGKSERLYKVGQQFMMSLLIIAAVGFYWVKPENENSQYFIVAAGIIAVFLLRSIWKNRKS